MELRDSYKDSGKEFDKVRSPLETIQWVEAQFEKSGISILQECVRVDKGRLGIPVYVSRYSPDAYRLTGTPKQMGKGVTAEQARCSAVMEMVERYSLFHFLKNGVLPVLPYFVQDSPKVPKSDLLRAVHHKGEEGRRWAEMEQLLDQFPHRWAAGLRAPDEEPCHVPFSWFWPINEYNGSASGNSLEEAAVQALSEVVERHCCSVISYGKLRMPTIDPASIGDRVLLDLLDRFERLGINIVLKDYSLDTGIPTVAAIAWDPSTYPERSEIVYTAGTSTSPERAAIRAVTEIAQLAGDFDTDGRYLESGLPKFATLEEADYVLDSSQMVALCDMPDCSSDNFRSELLEMARRLRAVGLPVYLLDITHPELQVPAVYAVVPGNHFRDRTIDIDLALHLARLATWGYLAPQESLALLERVHALYPDRYETAFYMGHVNEQLGMWEEALGWIDKAVSMGPSGPEMADLLCHRAFCLKELGRLDEAASDLERARKINPDHKEVQSLLGYCHYSAGRYYEAIECFERAIELDPASAIDYANIGSNLRKLGMLEAAKNWYRMALDLDPGIEWAREHLQELGA